MDNKTVGAWIIHHTKKLQGVHLPRFDYDHINLAGKCGILLSALSRSSDSDLPNDKVELLAQANGLSATTELPTILNKLDEQRLIDKGSSGISVLGLTTIQTLEYTANIYNSTESKPCEEISIDLAEKSSRIPIIKDNLLEYVSDTYHMSDSETTDILNQCEQIRFFDFEDALGEKVYFNGNLFRRENMRKTKAILSSLNSEDEKKVSELIGLLKAAGCVPKAEVVKHLGDELYSKVCAIGFIDENSIGNEKGISTFITMPAAFTKFTNTAADDAFDLAKAFVTSLTYGMTMSSFGRGRIVVIEALMKKLINGEWVGPATAIGQDYKVLEMKGVVELKQADNNMFNMRLLKPEVGELALLVIKEGDVGGAPLLELPGASATRYDGPELNRMIMRKQQAPPLKKGAQEMLRALRTGGTL